MKTKFQRSALLVSFLLVGHLSHAQTANGPSLTGQVILPLGELSPATVLIVRADRKPSTPITARNPGLPKTARTDEQGGFAFGSLDSGWTYSLVIVAPGCRPASFDNIDAIAAPLTAHLDAVNPSIATTDSILHGRVLDAHRNPVPNALIRILEVTRNGTMYFSPNKIDQYTVSDAAGNFVVYGQASFLDAGGSVQASGFATALFERWTVGETNHELTLVEGASLQGRLLCKEKPVADAEIRVDGFGAEAGSWMWNESTKTDNRGGFLFTHLPANRTCRIHGATGSLGDLGAVPTQTVEIHGNGSTNLLGDLELDRTFRIDGRVRLPGGKAMPTNSHLYFGDFSQGMSPEFVFDSEGGFHLTGCPAGTLTLYLRVPGYQLTPRDRMLIGGTLTNITITSNISGMTIDLHPWTSPAH